MHGICSEKGIQEYYKIKDKLNIKL